MNKRLSDCPPKPRFGFSLPGYPTLAASLLLSLAPGCGSSTPDKDKGSETTKADASDPWPPYGGKAPPPYPDAAVEPEDSAVPDTTRSPRKVEPSIDGSAPVDTQSEAGRADLAGPEATTQPRLAGGAPASFDLSGADEK